MPDTLSSVEPPRARRPDDKMFFEPERLSYQSADAIAVRIAEAVKAT